MPISPFFQLAQLWQQGQQQQQNEQYRQALLHLDRQNQQLQARQTLAALAEKQRQNQAQSALWQAYSRAAAQPQQPVGTPSPMMSGGALPSSFPQVPDATGRMADNSAALGLIEKDESGGRNINNYRFDPQHTAGGKLQITDSTWNRYAPSVGAPLLHYPQSPKDVDPATQYKVGGAILRNEGTAPWANFNPKLAADLKMSPEIQQQGSGLAIQAAGRLPPQMVGQASPSVIAQMLQNLAGVDAPDDVKGAALIHLLPLMSQDGQRQFQDAMDMLRYKQTGAHQQVEEAGQAETRAERERHDRAMENKGAGGTGEKLEASKMFDIVDESGKVVRGGVMARERKDQAGFIDSQSGQPITLKPGEHLKQITATTSGGGRAGAQVLRQEIGGREVLSDLQNVAKLPVGTTIGPLGTVQPGTSIGGALKGDLVRTMTDQDSQLMQKSMANMTRELSILMSPVYGGNWAAQQIDPLIPKSGDTLGTVLFSIARLAQTADNALEAVSKSPILSNEQQEYATDIRKQIQQAIPWTPAQALEFAQGPDRKESFADFVGAGKLGGGQTQGGEAPEMTEEQYNQAQSGTRYRVPGNPAVMTKP